MQPGVRLQATVQAGEAGATIIRFTLPNGRVVQLNGPPMDARKIGPLDVMYYPEQFIQILLIEQGKGAHQQRIPIADMPI